MMAWQVEALAAGIGGFLLVCAFAVAIGMLVERTVTRVRAIDEDRARRAARANRTARERAGVR